MSDRQIHIPRHAQDELFRAMAMDQADQKQLREMGCLLTPAQVKARQEQFRGAVEFSVAEAVAHTAGKPELVESAKELVVSPFSFLRGRLTAQLWVSSSEFEMSGAQLSGCQSAARAFHGHLVRLHGNPTVRELIESPLLGEPDPLNENFRRILRERVCAIGDPLTSAALASGMWEPKEGEETISDVVTQVHAEFIYFSRTGLCPLVEQVDLLSRAFERGGAGAIKGVFSLLEGELTGDLEALSKKGAAQRSSKVIESLERISSAVKKVLTVEDHFGLFRDPRLVELFSFVTEAFPNDAVANLAELSDLVRELEVFGIQPAHLVKLLNATPSEERTELFLIIKHNTDLLLPLPLLKGAQQVYGEFGRYIQDMVSAPERFHPLRVLISEWAEIPALHGALKHLVTHYRALAEIPDLAEFGNLVRDMPSPVEFLSQYGAKLSGGRPHSAELLLRVCQSGIKEPKLSTLKGQMNTFISEEAAERILSRVTVGDPGLKNRIEEEIRAAQGAPRDGGANNLQTPKPQGKTWQQDLLEQLKGRVEKSDYDKVSVLLDEIPENLRTVPKRFFAVDPDLVVLLARDFAELKGNPLFDTVVMNERYRNQYRLRLAEDKGFPAELRSQCAGSPTDLHQQIETLLFPVTKAPVADAPDRNLETATVPCKRVLIFGGFFTPQQRARIQSQVLVPVEYYFQGYGDNQRYGGTPQPEDYVVFLTRRMSHPALFGERERFENAGVTVDYWNTSGFKSLGAYLAAKVRPYGGDKGKDT